MNKFTLFLGLTLATTFFLQSTRFSSSNSGGAPVSHTGAPKSTSGNELTCTNCHGGTVNTGANSVAIEFDGNPETMLPNEVYTVTVSIPGSTASSAGFQMVSLTTERENCGTFTSTPGNKNVVGSGRTYITHSNKNNTTWTFTWTAPSTLPDSVFFYAASREVSGGSKTYTSKKKFINNITSTKSDFANEAFLLYPAVSDGRIFVKVNSLFDPFATIHLLDINGRILFTKEVGLLETTGREAIEINLPSGSNSGLYYCQLVTESQRIVKKFYKS